MSRVVVLTGGVGGVKLVDGLAAVLPAGDLAIVVNTGDDLDHWGLRICPDLDTTLYTLGGLAPPDRGWGRIDERFDTLEEMGRLGGETWFALGNRDLAIHLTRTRALREGRRLTEVIAELATAFGVDRPVLPMADEPRPTTILTADHGPLPFQEWLVRRRAPAVTGVEVQRGPATPEVLAALDAADLVVVGPSNPYVSIDPILALDGVVDRLRDRRVVAVSPIVGGAAVKGPLAEMIPAIAGVPPSPSAIAAHYAPWLDGLVLEAGDPPPDGLPTRPAATVMRTPEDRRRLAREVLAFAAELG